MLNVKLLSHTANPETIVAAAAKLCYASSSIDDLMDKLDDDNVSAFIDKLSSMGHESPFEHMSFTFGIEGVSRSLLAQITRHRIASYSVKSQRYVKEGAFEFVTPPYIEEDEEAKKIYLEAMAADQKAYDELTEILFKKHYDRLISEGKDEKTARRTAEKTAIEDARFVLPNSCETKMVATFNARSLFNFFNHRCCSRAQWEIQALANEMLKLVREVAPTVFKNAGPKCISGPCPEGAMSCGKRKEMIEFYNNL